MEPAPVADRLEPEADDAVALDGHRYLVPPPSVTLTASDLAAIEGLQARHAAATAQRSATVVRPTPDVAAASPNGSAARCPIPGVAGGSAGACPISRTSPSGAPRSRADLVMRHILRIRDEPRDLSDAAVYRTFQRSMLISAIRCTLTYVVFPFVLPALSFAKGVGPVIGIVVGTVALVCDTLTIRRFFSVDHKYRWYFTSIALTVMGLLAVLLVQDISHVVGNLMS